MFNPGVNNVPWTYLRNICVTIDTFIYFILNFVFKVFFNITNVNFMDNEIVNTLYSNIQLLLGIYITFKLIFSLLNYLIDPDKIKDNKVGVKNLIMRIVVSLSLLTLLIPMSGIPESNLITQNSNGDDIYTFNYYLKQKGILFGTLDIIQDRILDQNIIGKLIFGGTNSNDLNSSFDSQASSVLSTVLKAFIFIPVDDNDNPLCTPDNSDDYEFYNDTVEYNTILDLADNSVCSSGDNFAFSYIFLGSWICGALFIVIVAGFCIDVATRLIKLTILRLIAPIPIISYINPDSSKNGAFSAWTKMLTKTYLDLFVRIAVIYFITYLASSIVTNDIVFISDSLLLNGVSRVLIILALFLFAKQAPKFLMDMLGIKGDGKGFFSGIGAVAGLGAFTGGLVGSAVSDARNRFSDAREEGHGVIRSGIGAALAGAAGAFGGGIAGAQGFLTTNNGHYARNIRDYQQRRNARAASGSTLPGRIGSTIMGDITGRDAYDRLNLQVDDLGKYDDLYKRLETKADADSTFLSSSGMSVKALKNKYQDLKDSGTATDAQIEAAREAYDNAKAEYMTAAFNKGLAGSPTDAEAYRTVEMMNKIANKQGIDIDTDKVKLSRYAAQDKKNQILEGREYKIAKANHDYANKNK